VTLLKPSRRPTAWYTATQRPLPVATPPPLPQPPAGTQPAAPQSVSTSQTPLCHKVLDGVPCLTSILDRFASQLIRHVSNQVVSLSLPMPQDDCGYSSTTPLHTTVCLLRLTEFSRWRVTERSLTSVHTKKTATDLLLAQLKVHRRRGEVAHQVEGPVGKLLGGLGFAGSLLRALGHLQSDTGQRHSRTSSHTQGTSHCRYAAHTYIHKLTAGRECHCSRRSSCQLLLLFDVV
jgi:hypothetical protein